MCDMTDKVIALTEHAYKYGPFLFALLFNLILTGLAHHYYRKASPEDKSTYRYHFGAISVIGLALVVISVVWWFVDRPKLYVFKGVIQNLREYEKIVSGSLYLRPQSKPKLVDSSPEEIRDVYFIAVRDTPFEAGQTFDLSYGKDHKGETAPPTVLEIEYSTSDKTERKYKIEYDSKIERNVLTEIAVKTGHSGRLQGVAFAYESIIGLGRAIGEKQIVGASPTIYKISFGDDAAVGAIERSSSKVSEKIAGLDRLLMLNERDLSNYFEEHTPESRVITILDLTRHTDDELASKARKVIKRYDVTEHVANQLFSNDPFMRQAAEEILFRIEPDRAESVLDLVTRKNINKKDRIPAEKIEEWRRLVRSGENTRLIMPTGTSFGDVYYLRAEWKRGTEIPLCMAKILYTAVSHSKDESSLENYEAKLTRATAYYVYARDKFQTLNLAHAIERCGAKVSLVHYNP